MAVETVAHIRTVGNAFHDSVHLAELLYLKAAETLCRRSVDRIKVAVLLFELVHLVVDIFQHIQSELAVLSDGFAVIELLQLVQRRNSKRRRHGLQDLADLLMGIQMSAVESSLAVCKRIG